MNKKAFLVDTTKCSGCRACQVACKQWNNLPAESTTFFGGPEYTNPAELSAITFNHVKFFPVDLSKPEKPVWTIMHKKCYHCENANCQNACPENAIRRLDGWTVIDHSRCIGCGACTEACVYNVPHVLEDDMSEYGTEQPLVSGKAYKCHACTVNTRDIPACASVCPTNALTYGNREDLVKKAKARLDKVKPEYPHASIYGLKEFDGLGVITILKNSPDKFGLPVNPKPISAEKIMTIHAMYAFLNHFTLGLPSLKRTAYRISKNLVG
ncbi:MAG: 4Fe-4S dicluster domain-containing protein [Desulfobacterales bacterium]|nr:4Fe-4S dicluster domain-containing protein [Desulfobacterales bacterium]